MDKQINGQMGKQINGQMVKWIYRKIDKKLINTFTHTQIIRQIHILR